MKKIVIAGGSGLIGSALVEHFKNQVQSIVVLTRSQRKPQGNVKYVTWDGEHLGEWANELADAEVLINLTGKSVNCRYTKKNRDEILSSRLNATKILGEVVEQLESPPALWIQASSATIYRHSEDKPMDEINGEIGEDFSMGVCRQWERALRNIDRPHTRKVILRIGIVLSPKDGALPLLTKLVTYGLGGSQGKGTQWVSWIHIHDLVNIFNKVCSNENAEGIYNCTAPIPIQNHELMRALRKTLGKSFSLSLPAWLLEVGAIFIRTETELVLKSRWVIPNRLLKEGFEFNFPNIYMAFQNLINAK